MEISLLDEYLIFKQSQTIKNILMDFKMIDAKAVYTLAEAQQSDDNSENKFFPYRELLGNILYFYFQITRLNWIFLCSQYL